MNKIHETREEAVWRTNFWINLAYFYWTRSESKSEAGCICQKIFPRFPISLKHRSAKKKLARSQKSTNGKSGFFLQDIRISLLVFLGVLCSQAFFRVLCSHAQTSIVQSIYISSTCSSFEKCAMILLPTFLINAPPVATSRAVNEAALGSGTSLAVRHTGLLFWHMVGLKKRSIPKCFNLLGLHPSRASISLGSLRSNHSMRKETHFVSSSKYRWAYCFLAFHLMCHILVVGASTQLSFLFSEQISMKRQSRSSYFH